MPAKIISFSIENYASFKKKITLDFIQHGKFQNNSENIRYFKEGKKNIRLLPALGLYGKNGCGKTNLLNALYAHCIFEKMNTFNPFSFTSEIGDYTKSELIFINKDIQYRHIVHYGKDILALEKFEKQNKDGVFEEVFMIDRVKDKCSLSSEDDNLFVQKFYDKDDDKVLLEKFTHFYPKEYGRKFLPTIIMYDKWRSGRMSRSPRGSRLDRGRILDRSRRLEYMNILMSNIQNHFYKITEDKGDDRDFNTHYRVGEEEKEYTLPFVLESQGTHKLARLALYIVYTLIEGAILCIDEIENELHPEALKFIIECFKSPTINKDGAVLVFSTHSMKTIDFIDHENVFLVDRDYEDYTSSIEKPVDYEDYNKRTFKKDFEDGLYGSTPIITIELFSIMLNNLRNN